MSPVLHDIPIRKRVAKTAVPGLEKFARHSCVQKLFDQFINI